MVACQEQVAALTVIVLWQDYRVVVRIDSWESTSVYPNGHFVRVLGRIGDLEGEIAAILVENSICVAPFSEIQVGFGIRYVLFLLILEDPLTAGCLGLPKGF